jgi:Domain of unknown function (DUF1993)
MKVPERFQSTSASNPIFGSVGNPTQPIRLPSRCYVFGCAGDSHFAGAHSLGPSNRAPSVRGRIAGAVKITTRPRAMGATAQLPWTLPHFYFHLITAYDILRHNGVVIDKQDYFYPAASIGSFGIDCIRHPSGISWTHIGVHPSFFMSSSLQLLIAGSPMAI